MLSAVVVPVVIMLVFQFALPLYMIRGVWRARQDTRVVWWLEVVSTGAYVMAFFLIGRWDWFSYYLRFVIVALFVAATGAGLRRARALPLRAYGRRGGRLAMASALIVGVAMTWFTGNALDIVQLNAFGARADALFSADVHRYVIFGAPVHSPCDGVVANAVDGLPDQVPPDADPEHPAGNHVVISCRGSLVHLAHLGSGSVKVLPGAHVFAGQAIGRVGNSGNTSEPHLHVHAVAAEVDGRKGEGKPILFDGLFPVRNSLLRR